MTQLRMFCDHLHVLDEETTRWRLDHPSTPQHCKPCSQAWDKRRRRDKRRKPEPDIVANLILGTGSYRKPYPVEVRAAIAYWNDRGWTAAQIAERVGCCRKTVERYRARMKEQA